MNQTYFLRLDSLKSFGTDEKAPGMGSADFCDHKRADARRNNSQPHFTQAKLTISSSNNNITNTHQAYPSPNRSAMNSTHHRFRTFIRA